MEKTQAQESKIADLDARISELERIEAAVNVAGFDVWENDRITGKIFGTGQHTFRNLGYSEEERPEKLNEVAEFIHPDDLKKSLQIVQDCFDGKTPNCYAEMRIRAKDGTWAWFAFAGKVIQYSEDGKARRFVGITYNIQSRNKADQVSEEVANKLNNALPEIDAPLGIVPNCSACKKVSDNQGCWSRIEAYVSQSASTSCSQDMRPECLKIIYPDCYNSPDKSETIMAAGFSVDSGSPGISTQPYSIKGILLAAGFVLVIIAGLFARELADFIVPGTTAKDPHEILVAASDEMNAHPPIEVVPGIVLTYTRVEADMTVVYEIMPSSLETNANAEFFRTSIWPQIRATVLAKPETKEMFKRGVIYKYRFFNQYHAVIDEETLKDGDELTVKDLMR